MFSLKSPRNILLIFYGIIIIVSLLVSAQLYFFIYENIYKAIYDSDQILILKSMVSIEPVNIQKFDEVINNLETKKKECPEIK